MRKRTMLLAAATALVTAASLGFGAGAMASASNQPAATGERLHD